MSNLFPPIEPYSSFFLQVSSRHKIYVEESGNQNGKPIVFIHGGPGGGIDPSYRRYFDPKVWRVILFDQRGCGKSTPFGELQENTTFDLVDDIETIREKLGIDSWDVFGGSWGSTLALTYAITHPARVKSLLLRGIFLLRKKEINWFYQFGASELYPEEWEQFVKPIPEIERGNLLEAYYKRLCLAQGEVVKNAAKAWSAWEGATSKLVKNPSLVKHFSSSNFAYAFARIECHYFYHKGFFDDDNFILNNIHRIKNIPGVIVQGRYDMPCPPVSAYELHKAWPKAEYHLIEQAGHSLSEEGFSDALLAALNVRAEA